MAYYLQRIKHPTFIDDRGSFTPIDLKLLNIDWIQANVSINENMYTFRGMHYQTNPPQTKYIKVVQGRIIDFAYNLDTHELSYFNLNGTEGVLIPNNYAHGFLTLEPDTIVTYLIEGKYNPESEHSIVWDTIPELKEKINSIVKNAHLTISSKDKLGK